MYNPHTPVETLFEILWKDSFHSRLFLIFLLDFPNINFFLPARVDVVCVWFLFCLSMYVYFARCVFGILFRIHKTFFSKFNIHLCHGTCWYTHSLTICLCSCTPKHVFKCACLHHNCSINLKGIHIKKWMQNKIHI